ncbi:MAG: hypothetical protein NTU80_00170, partial [Verrucomicrobia bacterium]|nr:hypothetical protein [Verrucomicrobiota bacterium]
VGDRFRPLNRTGHRPVATPIIVHSLKPWGNWYDFRTTDGYEVDSVFQLDSRLWAVEVNLTSNPTETEFARFNKAAEHIGADRRVWVAQVKDTVFNGQSGLASLSGLLELLGKEIE